MTSAIVDELAPDLIVGKAIGYESATQLIAHYREFGKRCKEMGVRPSMGSRRRL